MNRIQSIKSAAVFAVAVVCILSINATAQVMAVGKVIDEATGNGISKAVVMVKRDENSLLASYRTLTDMDGTIPSFNIGAYPGQVVVVRKVGYLPHTMPAADFDSDIALKRDPLEARIDSVMALMTNLGDKIAQMTQPHLNVGGQGGWGVLSPSTGGSPAFLYGSVLNGGDGYSSTFLNSMVTALNSWPNGRARIPTYYGKDAVHGNAGVPGYTVFPHNIGLGATRDSALVRRIGEATAKELWAAGIDLNFSPAISVARDIRWGRTYESYGETAELAVMMGAAMVRGLQGERYNAPWRITATAKHYMADGGTTNGADRGETVASNETLRAIHLPGYEAVVEQGVLSVMASFNTIKTSSSATAVHQHVDSLRMTVWLKTELGFDGYIISDWLGIGNSLTPGEPDAGGYSGGTNSSPTLTAAGKNAIKDAINAGIDLAMEPGTHDLFIQGLTELVNDGQVPQERINDAVRRILRAKFRAGRMDNFAGPSGFAGNSANINHADHRAIAREAVRKSQVLLKNENAVLPIAKSASIHVFGPLRDNIGQQCGGWTIGWQGVSGNSSQNFPKGTSILQGMQSVATGASFGTAENSDVIVYVTGENSYAEWQGDIETLNFPLPPKTIPGNFPGTTVQTGTDTAAYKTYTTDLANLKTYREQGKKIVTIFVAGRPRIVPELIEASDAFLAAWLPGTEGIGVADVLFGDHAPTGVLPFAWPGNGGAAQFAYGYGLDFTGQIVSVAPRSAAAVRTSAARVTVRNRTLTVKTPSPESVSHVRLIDMRGKSVKKFTVRGTGSYSLAKLPAGRYFVEMRDGVKLERKPIVIGVR